MQLIQEQFGKYFHLTELFKDKKITFSRICSYCSSHQSLQNVLFNINRFALNPMFCIAVFLVMLDYCSTHKPKQYTGIQNKLITYVYVLNGICLVIRLKRQNTNEFEMTKAVKCSYLFDLNILFI